MPAPALERNGSLEARGTLVSRAILFGPARGAFRDVLPLNMPGRLPNL